MYSTHDINETVFNAGLKYGYSKLEAFILSTRLEDETRVSWYDKEYLLKNFKEPDLNLFHDIDKASKRIIEAIDTKQHIIVLTDYDADGVGSASILYKGLLTLGVEEENLSVIINEREYGNGVNQTMLDKILEHHIRKEVGLVITADHGSADEERYKILKKKKIDIIVTDHHELQNEGPPTSVYSFINVKDPRTTFNRNISGATVAYYLLRYVNETKKKDIDYLLGFVAMTVISDQMPLNDLLNRYLYFKGIDEMNKDVLPWSLFHKEGEINESIINFTIAPLINSGNRMNEAISAFKFLSADTKVKAVELLYHLGELNTRRKRLTLVLKKEATRQFNNMMKIFDKTISIVLEDGSGVSGILASSFSELGNRPTGVFVKQEDGSYIGSFRSVGKVNLIEVFDKIHNKDKTIFKRYGGHVKAAGASVNPGKIKRFMELFEEFVNEEDLSKGPYVVDMNLHGNVDIEALHRSIHRFTPYGNSWRRPEFASYGTITRIFFMGFNDSYAKIFVDVEGEEISLFVMNSKVLSGYKNGDRVHVAYTTKLIKDKELSLTLTQINKE